MVCNLGKNLVNLLKNVFHLVQSAHIIHNMMYLTNTSS